MAPHVKKSARAVSLVKGIYVESGTPRLFSRYISSALGIPCTILSGANVAGDIAAEEFSECTLGYCEGENELAALWLQLLDKSYFKVSSYYNKCAIEMTDLGVLIDDSISLKRYVKFHLWCIVDQCNPGYRGH